MAGLDISDLTLMLQSKGLIQKENQKKTTTAKSEERPKERLTSLDMSQKVIILAIDSSEHSEYAFDWYAQYLHKPDNYVLLIHVPEGFDIVEKADKDYPVKQEQMVNLCSHITELESRYQHKLSMYKIHGRIVSIPSKTPGPTIIDAAKTHHAFAIVMGTRGLSKMKKVILGSVSDFVVQNALIPVIVVRNYQHP